MLIEKIRSALMCLLIKSIFDRVKFSLSNVLFKRVWFIIVGLFSKKEKKNARNFLKQSVQKSTCEFNSYVKLPASVLNL